MKLSVITINYNNRDGLKKTIESVVNQTYKDFEYIIIDGGSTDGSVEVLKEYSDKIDYWVSEPDKGIYNAMNKGIDIAKSEYCIFMNSGDLFYSNTTLSRILDHLDGTDIIYGNTQESNGNITKHKDKITFATLYYGSLCHQSAIIKTTLLQKFHYDESLKIVSDWKFFLQTLIFENSTYKGVDMFISTYDVSGLTFSNWNLFIKEREHVIESMFPKRIVDDIRELHEGKTWEDKLYIGIKRSRFNKLLYIMNVMIMKTMTFYKKSWISEFPNKL